MIEAPTEAYLDALLDSPTFAQYQSTATCEGDLAEVVVHFTPSQVIADSRYQEWMARFSPSTNHIFINGASSCMGSEAVHRIQYKLNHLSESLFPLLKDSGIPFKEAGTTKESGSDVNGLCSDCPGKRNENISLQSEEDNSNTNLELPFITGPTHQASTLLTYHIRPRKKLDR